VNSSPSPSPNNDGHVGGRLAPLVDKLGWDINPIAFLLPLFHYFTSARNCIVHRSARANEELVKYSQSPELSKCVAHWPVDRGKALPSLPSVETNREIPFLPRHLILASEVCYRAAKQLNSQLTSFLGVDGIVYMAAYHSLLADEVIPTNAKKSADRVINFVLDKRYRIQKPEAAEIIAILKRLGKWQRCRLKFQ
jgi:hypothetical protein